MRRSVAADVVRFAWAQEHRFVRELQELVRIPSVSAQPRHRADVERCAEWLSAHLAAFGLLPSIVQTAGHPIVMARSRIVAGRPTVLIYGHYDVQPTDPLADWKSDPFGAAIIGGALYGRGASDDKGQVFAHLKAIEAWQRARGGPPVNVLCLIEGEEETGSRHLGDALHRLPVCPTVAIVSDMPMAAADRPAITLGMRGTLAFDVELRGPNRDLHSGLFGGAILNPAQALVQLLAGFHDASGRVASPGFYDDVRMRGAGERARLARDAPTDDDLARRAGVSRLWGEHGFSGHERTTIRPALSINGLTAGYQGDGVKGIIPSRASAKVSVRLAADQVPERMAPLIARDLRRRCPAAVRLHVRWRSAARPVESSVGAGLLRIAAKACAGAFGRDPALLRSGGTIPALALFEGAGIPTLLVGFARPDDGAHGPNERFHLATFRRAITCSILILAGLGERNRTRERHS